MAHFAKIDENNVVTYVIVIPDEQEHRGQEFISKDLGLEGTWLQTSYNSIAGFHYDQNNVPDGKPAFRKNFAGIGYTYDKVRDAFIPPKPNDETFVLNEDMCIWLPPIEAPKDGKLYFWNSEIRSWQEAKEPKE